MFCPGCGRSGPDDLKFCTNCGTNLEAVKQVISVSAPIVPPSQTQPVILPAISQEIIAVEKARQRLKKIAILLFGATPIWAIIFLLLGDLVKSNFNYHLGKFIEDIAPFCMVYFLAAVTVLVYMKVMYKQTSNAQFVVVQQPQGVPTAPTLELPANQTVTQNELPPGRPLFANPQLGSTQQPLVDPYFSYEKPGTESPTNKLRQPQPIPRKQ